jgi:hypothetical protein
MMIGFGCVGATLNYITRLYFLWWGNFDDSRLMKCVFLVVREAEESEEVEGEPF